MWAPVDQLKEGEGEEERGGLKGHLTGFYDEFTATAGTAHTVCGCVELVLPLASPSSPRLSSLFPPSAAWEGEGCCVCVSSGLQLLVLVGLLPSSAPSPPVGVTLSSFFQTSPHPRSQSNLHTHSHSPADTRQVTKQRTAKQT